MIGKHIDCLGKRYWRNCLWLVAAMALVTLVVIQVCGLYYLVLPLIISSVFLLVTSFGYSLVWRIIASKHPDSLTVFYTAGSGCRFLFALATMFVYYLISGRSTMLPFIAVFVLYYFVMLSYHTVYFSKITADVEKSESGKYKKEVTYINDKKQ